MVLPAASRAGRWKRKDYEQMTRPPTDMMILVMSVLAYCPKYKYCRALLSACPSTRIALERRGLMRNGSLTEAGYMALGDHERVADQLFCLTNIAMTDILAKLRRELPIKLHKLSELKANWDSEGANPVDVRAIAAAEQFLSETWEFCAAIPLPNGGVQLESSDLEVEFSPDGTPEAMLFKHSFDKDRDNMQYDKLHRMEEEDNGASP